MTSKVTRIKDIAFELSLKSFNDSGSGEVEGYASVFGNIDHARDVIEHGAFAKTLQMNKGKIRFLWQHDRYQPIGAIIDMREDEKGLWFKAAFANTPRGQEARELLKMNGAMGGFSIGFQVILEAMDEISGINRIKEIRLLEISAVTFPCNEEATVLGVKSEFSDEEEELIGKFKQFLIAERKEEDPAEVIESQADVPETEDTIELPEGSVITGMGIKDGQIVLETTQAETSNDLEVLAQIKSALEVGLLLDTLRAARQH